MTTHNGIRIALALIVSVAFLFSGVAAVTACDGEELHCDGDADVETDDEKDDVYLTGSASGGASVTDADNLTTEHGVDVYVNSGFVDVSVEGEVERP